MVRAAPIIEALQEKISNSKGDLIIFMEMTWVVRTPSGDIYLRELQGAFQDFLSKYPNLKMVCIYNESILLDDQLLLGLVSQPVIYASKKIKDNPYFLPTEIIVHNQLRERFEYWLGNIDSKRRRKME